MSIKIYTTVAVGPDGRIFDLAKERFPKRKDYIPINAYTVLVEEKD